MRVQMKAFPVVYFTVKCIRHDCWVEIHPKTSTDSTDAYVIGGQLTALRCKIGGDAQHANCSDDWVINVSSSGPVTVLP